MTLNGCLHIQLDPQDPAYAEWEALLIDPSNELGYLRLASHYHATGQLFKAEQVYETGLKNIPNSERLASSLGRLYLSSGQTTVASDYYNENVYNPVIVLAYTWIEPNFEPKQAKIKLL